MAAQRSSPDTRMPSVAERAALRLAAMRAGKRREPPRHADWRSGSLRWKLDPKQQELYDAIRACPFGEFVTEGARKLGKSWVHGVIALETAIQNPGKRINWAAITGKESRGVLLPILEQLSADAPIECRGHHDSRENRWVLPNGAYIQLIGAETRKDCEKGRGPSSILSIIDEAGFHDHLEYLADSILEPQMRRVERVVGSFVGMLLLVSTTPYTPAHPFCKRADSAQVRGAYERRTIWDSGWQTREEIERFIASKAAEKNLSVQAFMATSTFRREYLSERVVDEERSVIPEWSMVGADGRTGAERCVIDWARPIGFQYVYRRTAVDPGGTIDPSGILSGYVDYLAGRVVIEGERLVRRASTKELFEAVVELETELWGDAPDPEPGAAYLDRQRISRPVDDPHGRITQDLWTMYRMQCFPAVKNDRQASIGLVRAWIAHGILAIHPRCVQLQHQLRTALNNKTRNDFERTEEGHCDLVAALLYFCRELSLVADPYPATFDRYTGRDMPPHHPVASRREAMGVGPESRGLAGQILSGNRYVQGQLRRRR